MKIIWRGNEHTNKFLSRKGDMPISIVNHITGGSASSADNWFRSSKNSVSSAHFLVTKNGEIKQYVKIDDGAWANGLTSGKKACQSILVQEKNYKNPNLYTVSIEHESKGESLTEAQYEASLWLHRYIKDYIKKKWGYDMAFDRKYIIGHYEIDSVRKPFCPGKNFPFDRLLKDLNMMDTSNKFNDENEISNWALSSVKKMYETGIMNGDISENFNPKDLLTREEMAVIIDRAIQFIKNGTIEKPQVKASVIEYLEVIPSALNVRDDVYGNKIGMIYEGNKLEKLGEKEGWYHIRHDGIQGYVHGDYVKKYSKTIDTTDGYHHIRRFDSDIHIFEADSKDFFVDVELGKYGKLEQLSRIKREGKEAVCKINGGFFDAKRTREHLGTFIDEGLYYTPPHSSFIDFIYYKDGTTEIKKIKGLEEIAGLQPRTHWVIGTSWSLVQKGEISLENTDKIDHSSWRNPRTLLGQREDGTFVLAVADGRKNTSKGLTAKQSAELMKELGCYNAVNLDGGGSSEMIVNDKIVNSPRDKGERYIGSAVLVYKK